MKILVVVFIMVILLLGLGYGYGYVGEAIMNFNTDSVTEAR
ncbi:hypothetical protein LCGC14_0830270 [marine sediment metagenome]|uniref:Uncharacterized protein n=1 Tax=marine sediment metagenome TaxID=412755 RepID=A0A0F9PKZ7_9ZZZZ